MRPVFALVAIAVAVALAVPAAAQSLAEIAAQTRKKREEQKKAGGGSGKVITDADLRSGGSGRYQPVDVSGAPAPEASPAATAGTAAAAPAGEKPRTDEELAAERQAAWREKLQKAQADIARYNEDINRYQTALNDLSGGPIYGGTRTGLMNKLEEARRSLAAAQQALSDTQEEGRRNGWR